MQRLLTVARLSTRSLSQRCGRISLSNPSVRLQPGANRDLTSHRPFFKSFSSMSPLNGSAVADDDFQDFGNFDLVKRIKLDYTDVVVSRWQSRVTGLTVVHLDYEGIYYISSSTPSELISFPAPLVNGYFVVGTESWCHSGLRLTQETN